MILFLSANRYRTMQSCRANRSSPVAVPLARRGAVVSLALLLTIGLAQRAYASGEPCTDLDGDGFFREVECVQLHSG
jgi:hypothetical protein